MTITIITLAISVFVCYCGSIERGDQSTIIVFTNKSIKDVTSCNGLFEICWDIYIEKMLYINIYEKDFELKLRNQIFKLKDMFLSFANNDLSNMFKSIYDNRKYYFMINNIQPETIEKDLRSNLNFNNASLMLVISTYKDILSFFRVNIQLTKTLFRFIILYYFIIIYPHDDTDINRMNKLKIKEVLLSYEHNLSEPFVTGSVLKTNILKPFFIYIDPFVLTEIDAIHVNKYMQSYISQVERTVAYILNLNTNMVSEVLCFILKNIVNENEYCGVHDSEDTTCDEFYHSIVYNCPKYYFQITNKLNSTKLIYLEDKINVNRFFPLNDLGSRFENMHVQPFNNDEFNNNLYKDFNTSNQIYDIYFFHNMKFGDETKINLYKQKRFMFEYVISIISISMSKCWFIDTNLEKVQKRILIEEKPKNKYDIVLILFIIFYAEILEKVKSFGIMIEFSDIVVIQLIRHLIKISDFKEHSIENICAQDIFEYIVNKKIQLEFNDKNLLIHELVEHVYQTNARRSKKYAKIMYFEPDISRLINNIFLISIKGIIYTLLFNDNYKLGYLNLLRLIYLLHLTDYNLKLPNLLNFCKQNFLFNTSNMFKLIKAENRSNIISERTKMYYYIFCVDDILIKSKNLIMFIDYLNKKLKNVLTYKHESANYSCCNNEDVYVFSFQHFPSLDKHKILQKIHCQKKLGEFFFIQFIECIQRNNFLLPKNFYYNYGDYKRRIITDLGINSDFRENNNIEVEKSILKDKINSNDVFCVDSAYETIGNASKDTIPKKVDYKLTTKKAKKTKKCKHKKEAEKSTKSTIEKETNAHVNNFDSNVDNFENSDKIIQNDKFKASNLQNTNNLKNLVLNKNFYKNEVSKEKSEILLTKDINVANTLTKCTEKHNNTLDNNTSTGLRIPTGSTLTKASITPKLITNESDVDIFLKNTESKRLKIVNVYKTKILEFLVCEIKLAIKMLNVMIYDILVQFLCENYEIDTYNKKLCCKNDDKIPFEKLIFINSKEKIVDEFYICTKISEYFQTIHDNKASKINNWFDEEYDKTTLKCKFNWVTQIFDCYNKSICRKHHLSNYTLRLEGYYMQNKPLPNIIQFINKKLAQTIILDHKKQVSNDIFCDKKLLDVKFKKNSKHNLGTNEELEFKKSNNNNFDFICEIKNYNEKIDKTLNAASLLFFCNIQQALESKMHIYWSSYIKTLLDVKFGQFIIMTNNIKQIEFHLKSHLCTFKLEIKHKMINFAIKFGKENLYIELSKLMEFLPHDVKIAQRCV